MTSFFRIFHRRSLTVSLIALFVSVFALGYLPEFSQRLRWHGSAFLMQSGIAAACGLLACSAALWNLIRDVERGYSPSRCSLAAVILFFAFASPIALGVIVLGCL
jgi:hypothetical protein